jgi:hypothetical protein
MPTIDEMNLEQVEETMAKLRERRRSLKQTGKAAERKIGTLARRRERLMAHVAEIDAQIDVLRAEGSAVPAAPRRRGRQPKAKSLVTT